MRVAAAALTVALGLVHSVLGERYIIRRVVRRDLPRLFGTDLWTKRILRFAWHLLTVSWFGIAAVLLVLAGDGSPRAVGVALIVTFAVSGVVIAIGSRGRHAAWVVSLVIAGLIWAGL